MASARATIATARSLGVDATVNHSWEFVTVQGDRSGRGEVKKAARPDTVNMGRVVAAGTAALDFREGRTDRSEFESRLEQAEQVTTSPVIVFALGAIVGACALGVIFGVADPTTLGLIAMASGAGALLRRAAARLGVGSIGQATLAALIAGIVGALAMRFGIGAAPTLISLCACMILVPGPHILNGGLDAIGGRMQLAVSRLAYAAVILLGICIGLVVGMAVCGVTLPVTASTVPVGFWPEVTAAAATGYAYSVFFSTPGRLVIWPMVVAMLAHSLRWVALHNGSGLVLATLCACLLAGALLFPLARRFHLPYAPLIFASVVSMIPGSYVFRATSGLLELAGGTNDVTELAAAVVQDSAIALAVSVAVVLGVALPAIVGDRLISFRQANGER